MDDEYEKFRKKMYGTETIEDDVEDVSASIESMRRFRV